MKTPASGSVRDGECLCVYPKDGLGSVALIDHDMVGGCYLLCLCAQMKYQLWSRLCTVRWHPWKENISEGRRGQGFPAKQDPGVHTYPRSQQSGLRRIHGWRADGWRPGESSWCSQLLARCARWSLSGWLSGLISGNVVNQWHWQLSLHQAVSSAPQDGSSQPGAAKLHSSESGPTGSLTWVIFPLRIPVNFCFRDLRGNKRLKEWKEKALWFLSVKITVTSLHSKFSLTVTSRLGQVQGSVGNSFCRY